jgi:hypothetical protein
VLHAGNLVWHEFNLETFAPLLVRYFGPKRDQTFDTRACFSFFLPSSSASTVIGAPDRETPSPTGAMDFDMPVDESQTTAKAYYPAASLDIPSSSSHERDFK